MRNARLREEIDQKRLDNDLKRKARESNKKTTSTTKQQSPPSTSVSSHLTTPAPPKELNQQ